MDKVMAKMKELAGNDAVLLALATLRNRWADEKEYEDFANYGPVLSKELPEGVSLVKMTKRPFGAIIRFARVEAKFKLILKNYGSYRTLRVEGAA